MKYLSLFITILVANNAASMNDVSIQKHWDSFKINYKKNYNNDDVHFNRFAIFKTNLEKIEAHNQMYVDGKTSYIMGLNQFADLTPEEFAQFLNPSHHSKYDKNPGNNTNPKSDQLPDSIDWRELGVVTPIQNQGVLGAGGYGVIGSLEAQYALHTNELATLSHDYLISCMNLSADEFYNAQAAFQFVIDTGICRASDYNPGDSCDDVPILFKAVDYVEIERGNEGDLQEIVGTIGPVEVTIDASGIQLYASGVYYDEECSATQLNHEVLVVGYAHTDDGLEYWLVKNSWGTEWGEAGYVRMARNRANNCGIASAGNFPII